MTPDFEILKRHKNRLSVIFGSLPETCIHGSGYKNASGYTWIQFRDNRIKYAILGHRAAYSLFNNEELCAEDVIMHTCDNPNCINPNHLKKGSHNDNVQDRVNKNRSAVGEANGNYKHGKWRKRENLGLDPERNRFILGHKAFNRVLSDDEVLRIKNAIANKNGESWTSLALRIGYKPQLLKDINRGQCYKDIQLVT